MKSEATEEIKKEIAAPKAKETKVKREVMEEEEEEDLEPEPEEEEWVSEEEYTESKKRGKRSHRNEDEDEDEDEDYGRNKRRKVTIVKKSPSAQAIRAAEPNEMKALRKYTSALKLGPRCFRGLNKISDIKEREALLISRLHDCGRSWSGEYPSEEDIKNAKEETRQKKAEKAKQFIIDEEDGVRSSRKAAQRARDFVKNLGENDEPVDDEVDGEVEPDLEDEE